MTSFANATKQPVHEKIMGVDLYIRPLVIRDLGRLEQWMREQIIAAGRANLIHAMPGETSADRKDRMEMNQAILREAYSAASHTSLADDDGVGMLSSIGGMMEMIRVALAKDDRNDMDILGQIEDSDSLSALAQIVMRNSGLAKSDPTTPQEKGQEAPTTPAGSP